MVQIHFIAAQDDGGEMHALKDLNGIGEDPRNSYRIAGPYCSLLTIALDFPSSHVPAVNRLLPWNCTPNIFHVTTNTCPWQEIPVDMTVRDRRRIEPVGGEGEVRAKQIAAPNRPLRHDNIGSAGTQI